MKHEYTCIQTRGHRRQWIWQCSFVAIGMACHPWRISSLAGLGFFSTTVYEPICHYMITRKSVDNKTNGRGSLADSIYYHGYFATSRLESGTHAAYLWPLTELCSTCIIYAVYIPRHCIFAIWNYHATVWVLEHQRREYYIRYFTQNNISYIVQ